MRIEIQWNSLFPLSMPYVTTLQYREIFWQNGSLLYGSDTAKQEFFMRLQLRLQSLHKHDFISNQLLFYCWLTQQHFNFSVSFSFKHCTYVFLSNMSAESPQSNHLPHFVLHANTFRSFVLVHYYHFAVFASPLTFNLLHLILSHPKLCTPSLFAFRRPQVDPLRQIDFFRIFDFEEDDEDDL